MNFIGKMQIFNANNSFLYAASLVFHPIIRQRSILKQCDIAIKIRQQLKTGCLMYQTACSNGFPPHVPFWTLSA